MDNQALYNELAGLIKGRVSMDEPMSKHTTWRIGGPADILVEPGSLDDLSILFRLLSKRGIPVTVLGNGSNMLVGDGGIRGVVVKAGHGLSEINISELVIRAGAGVMLSRLATAARDSGIGGFEFAAGIPGTIGGAVVMNAGANGSCMADVVQVVVLMDRQGNFHRLEAGEIGFSYRSSNLQHSDRMVVEVLCRGVAGNPAKIQAEMEEYLRKRKESQPLGFPNAGSVFKNPNGYSAGKLIEEAGCKGLTVGDARVSEVHANFIVNLGKARAMDVVQLIELVKSKVYGKTGVMLETEVKLLGDN